MYVIEFIFWELIKVAGLAVAGLIGAKLVSGLGRPRPGQAPGKLPDSVVLRGAFYAILLVLVALGAGVLGENWAAAIYFWAGTNNLSHTQVEKACDNAQRAVNLRPKELEYWRLLERARIQKGERTREAEARRELFASVVGDERVIRSLNGGNLPNEDAIRLAAAYYGLGQYDQVVMVTDQVIERDRYYAAPYILQGAAYMAEKKYEEAEKRFLAALQVLPTQVEAVNGLAQAYFLAGEKERALAVLEATRHYSFAPEARKHFDDLKAQYGR